LSELTVANVLESRGRAGRQLLVRLFVAPHPHQVDPRSERDEEAYQQLAACAGHDFKDVATVNSLKPAGLLQETPDVSRETARF